MPQRHLYGPVATGRYRCTNDFHKSMKRKKFIAGNHKMHTTLAEGMQLAKDIRDTLKERAEGVDVLLIPPFTHLYAVAGMLDGTPFLTGAQNCATHASGAFTGEISAGMLASAGASHVLVGHSERRQLFDETADILRQKMRAALDAGLKVIYCYGETLEDREAGTHIDKISAQLDLLKNFPADWPHIVLAYEPVWAIGTGRTATPAQAQDIHAYTRVWVKEHANETVARTVRILYGGSVKADNAAELLIQPDIDGALVGGASLQADSFSAIVHAAASA